jgi:hypothetical protein
MAALIAVYLALFGTYRLARGEKPMLLVLASSQEQAKVVFAYAKAFLIGSPVLQQEIENITRFEIQLKNGVTIAVHSNSFRTVRGRTLIACVMDECAFWRDETSAMPDIETYRAVLPSLATTDGMLLGISTPYRKLGLLHAKYRDHFAHNDHEVLVVRGVTQQFNPTLSGRTIAAQRQADPTAAASEWDAEFRTDIASFLDDELIESAVEHGRPLELPPGSNGYYRAFCDASGGAGHDSYTVAVGHKGGEHFVIDLVRGTVGKVDPDAVTKLYAALLKEYRISTVFGDAYAAQWVAGAWQNTGIAYVKSDIPKSQIYLECIPLFTRGLVRLPNHPRLLRELRMLERHTHRSGRDTVDHPRNGKDDHANAVCGVLRGLSNYLGYDETFAAWQPNFVDRDADPAAKPPTAAEAASARCADYVAAYAHTMGWL